MRFLLRWQHVAPGTQRQGRAGCAGRRRPAPGLRARRRGLGGSRPPGTGRGLPAPLARRPVPVRATWPGAGSRCAPADADGSRARGSATPSRATPVTFTLRDGPALAPAAPRGRRRAAEEPAHGPAGDVLDALRAQGAMFHSDLRNATGRLPGRGGGGAVGPGGARASSPPTGSRPCARCSRPRGLDAPAPPERRRLGSRPPAARRPARPTGEGRWALLPAGPGPGPGSALSPGGAGLARDDLAEQVAGQLLARWGVVFWDLMAHENLALPWRESSGRCAGSKRGAWCGAAAS